MQLKPEENKATVWVVESPALMRRFVEELWKQADGREGGFVLSEDGKILDFGKNAEVLLTPFGIDSNEKKCWNKALTELKSMAFDEEHYLQTQQLYTAIQQYVLSLELDSELDFQYEEIDFSQLIKTAGMKLEVDNSDLGNNIVLYLKVLAKLLRKRLVIFVNLSAFLEERELEQLLQESFYMKLHVLLIECREINLACEKKYYIIDKDKCEIY